MDKGSRVAITGGRQGVGQTGTIFWKGPNKFGPGDRFGVRGDDGATYWVTEDQVESTDASPPPPPSDLPTFARGDRVMVEHRGEDRVGEVFWTGESRAGGQRLGVRAEPDGETIWIDARFVTATTAAPPEPARDERSAPTAGHARVVDDEDLDEVPVELRSPSLGMDELPPFAPIDDDDIASWEPEDEDAGDAW